MKISMLVGRCGALAMALLAVGLCQPAAAGEEATVKVFSSWQGVGNTFTTGPKQATFVGAMTGPMYVDTEKGPLQSGMMVCPAIVTLGLDDASVRTQARCTITAKDGAAIYAEIACTGVYLVGCTGDLTLTGGTGRFAGVSGGGRVTIRTELRQTTAVSADVSKDQGWGILFVRELHYKLP